MQIEFYSQKKKLGQGLPMKALRQELSFVFARVTVNLQTLFVLTTPLYYVNAPPHLGSAYTAIVADAVARFQRLLGKKVIFITGTDEHGEKIAAAAAASGSSPSEHCDVISQSYKTLWKDILLMTSSSGQLTPKHEAIVKEFYSRVLANGDIYKADYEGLRERATRECCPIHLKPCLARKEDNYFFALSKYQNVLSLNFFQCQFLLKPHFWSNFLRSGLRDFSISRASVDLGIPVPNDTKQTIYVWFDALLGYISALSEDKDQSSLQTAISSGWPASLHLIGKVEHARVHYENLSLSSACEAVVEIGNTGNSYIDERAPWSLFKQGGDASEAAAKDLLIILEVMRIIAVALSPVTPNLCWRIYEQLGYSKDRLDSATWPNLRQSLFHSHT
ncbi:hypothetical protein Ddye_014215 [Dipteronia dyeriana]|uniref:methionine--tRNA ligase n=1 Tax=Dipteronia dyeriana TaxID=168575 RepID=A0AAD9X7R9_9ROSI|nr:hypothetical protein Ddye_014215 [Dipteronia dyeriana]